MEFAVVAGKDGVALVGGAWLEKVPELADEASYGVSSIDIGTSAAVLAGSHMAVVRPHRPPAIADCADCAGIAATGENILTSRKNYTPGGFEIVLFKHDLAVDRIVTAERLQERGNTDYGAENTASPVVLAAEPGRVTVGYLARDGGVRRGPSVVAQYDFDGRLINHVVVDGILGRSTVSADGRRLAVGVGGSGGACITSSVPVIIELDSMQVRTIEPDLLVTASGAYSWFLTTDLDWRTDLLTVMGELHDPPPGETCDPSPKIWRRDVDPATAIARDTAGQNATARRWNGPGCDDVIEVNGNWASGELVRRSGGKEERLGNYATMSLGRSAAEECGQK
ncbi:hypothetical protein ACWGE0_11905 [Lentzea sp. NPDC054927]